jgi:Kef-type K+ transport system membrane component KefB
VLITGALMAAPVPPGAASHSDLPALLLTLAFLLVGAKLAGELAERLGQPAVLGELTVGILLGNAALVAGPELRTLQASESFVILAEIGAILLLFQVGLESTPREMMAIGGRATLVAVAGVIAPMALGFGVGLAFRPEASWMFHAFLGSMLAATSVGITARVLSDLRALGTPAARIILGAAVIDDVLGLVILAVVSGIIQAAATGASIGPLEIVRIAAGALIFLVGALFVGGKVSPHLFRASLNLRSANIALTLALSFCFLLSALALVAGLAPIVGAFAAGLVLEDAHFRGLVDRGERPLHEALQPLVALFVPVFFVRMGMMVDLAAFARPSILGFAAALTLAAVAGKMACMLATPRTVPRLVVGIGMMPRGEVGLIFAAIGGSLVLEGRPVIDAGAYAAAVFMVVATTLATPPLLAWALRRANVAPANVDRAPAGGYGG